MHKLKKGSQQAKGKKVMIKAVNMKGFRFGKNANMGFRRGFGMLNTETNEFYSFDGVTPYVLETKKLVQSCINGNWVDTLKTVKVTAYVG